MKIGILTTETTHHAHYIKALSQLSKHQYVALVESNTLKAPFQTAHPFEQKRAQYEIDNFFNGSPPSISQFCETHVVNSINDTDALTLIQKIEPDCLVVFGTGKIKPPLVNQYPSRLINLHGGDPEEYRGLDSHLWAIYHQDFKGLVVTLHQLNPVLDDGHIILKEQLAPQKNAALHELRMLTTEACVRLTLAGLNQLEMHEQFLMQPQKKIGRYYSFMPTDLKEICVKNFEKYTRSLP